MKILLWVIFAIALIPQMLAELLGEVVWWIVRPFFRLGARMLNRVTLTLLWAAALGSFVLLPYGQNASSTVVQAFGLLAFMGMTPLALTATFHRRRTRATAVPVRGRLWSPQE